MKLLLITPPFTQLNTPYPATAYLKGFLNTQNINSYQCDLGLEVILKLFTRNGLTKMFACAQTKKHSENASRIFALKEDYCKTIEQVVLFLQNKNQALANLICTRNYLPEASRFANVHELEWAFGSVGTHDLAKHIATLYLVDIADFITEVIDPNFGFSRYAERLGRTAATFDKLHKELKKNTFIDSILLELLDEKIQNTQPNLITLSVPFPGNLYSAFKCAQHIKKKYPSIKIALGGGYPNTELRQLKDKRVFEYFDFICLDDGERPLLNLIEHLKGNRKKEDLKRTFALEKEEVKYFDASIEKDFTQAQTGTPDYSNLLLNQYISVIEMPNLMHKMWSDGRWNKLTLAHGCYWGKCTFCDTTLDYIKNYQAGNAKLLVDKIETIIKQTNSNGFHFVDEAAPPALMRELALEIIRRKLTVVWWTNIRFEKSFSADLCRLLAASGCVAVSGGLEVASPRLLKLINKGVTLEQVAQVTNHFTLAGIMVHAYLMYGFPTQTVQETIDSLEVVRQLFEVGVVQSAYWHQFAMTKHSPIGTNPSLFGVKNGNKKEGTFANNDLMCIDEKGAKHEKFSKGLNKALFNYMHNNCIDSDLQDWFDFYVPNTQVPFNFIENAIYSEKWSAKNNDKLLWLGGEIKRKPIEKKGKKTVELRIHTKENTVIIHCSEKTANLLLTFIPQLSISYKQTFCYAELKDKLFKHISNAELLKLKEIGLLFV